MSFSSVVTSTASLLKAIVTFSWLLRPILIWHPYRRFQLMISFPAVKRIHSDVMHPIRELSAQFEHWDVDEKKTVTQANQVCSAIRRVFCRTIGLDEHDVHVSIKTMHALPDGSYGIRTFARSDPRDARTIEDAIEPIAGSSSWAALFEEFDGKTKWDSFTCFCCNDLWNCMDFQCPLPKWKQLFRSKLVFPLRYPKASGSPTSYHFGFLVVDSPKPKAFLGMPNIFDFRSDPASYNSALSKSALFHIGAVFADMLGTGLGPSYSAFDDKSEDEGNSREQVQDDEGRHEPHNGSDTRATDSRRTGSRQRTEGRKRKGE